MGYFDDTLSETSAAARPKEPIWALNLDDKDSEEKVLTWLNGEISYLIDYNHDRLQEMQVNLNLYSGIQYRNQQVRNTTRDIYPSEGRSANNGNRLIINHLYDLTERKVSETMTNKPAVNVMPTNTEYADEIAAKTTTAIHDHIKYNENFDLKVEKVVRHRNILGEGYLFIEWNKDKGDIHQDSPIDKFGNKTGKKVVLMNENGHPTIDDSGKEVKIEQLVRVGDVEYTVVLPNNVFFEVKDEYDDASYMYRRETVTTEELRLQFPDAASMIKANAAKEADGTEDPEDKRSLSNQTIMWTFYHKRTSFMPNGRQIKFTREAILENIELPYSMEGEFPCERLPDIEVPAKQHAYSFYRNARGPATQYNNLSSMILKNQMMASHPKWMVPVGSTKLASLGNDITMVQYKGPVPPSLAQSNPTPQEVFVFRDALKGDFEQISGVSGVARGNPPSGITAAVALQFLSEEDAKRSNSAMLKYNDFIVGCARKTIAIAADFYDKSDNRMARVLGKNDAWQAEIFDVTHLSKTYDIRVQQSSALPKTKSGKLQFLLDISERFPDAIPAPALADMLDLGQSSKFLERTAVSVKSAEAENEDIMSGKKPHEPEMYEGLIDHWQTHVARIREANFKRAPKNVQENMKDHIMATEYVMMQMLESNPSFGEKLQALGEFPLFTTPPPPPPPLPEELPPEAQQELPPQEAELPPEAQLQPPEGLA